MIDETAPECIEGNGMRIGYIPEIHGPKSKSFEITKYEAEIIARGYLDEIAYVHRCNAAGYSDSGESGMRYWGWRRIGDLVDAGMLTEEELRGMADEIMPSKEELQRIQDEEERRYGVYDDDSPEGKLLQREETELAADLQELASTVDVAAAGPEDRPVDSRSTEESDVTTRARQAPKIDITD